MKEDKINQTRKQSEGIRGEVILTALNRGWDSSFGDEKCFSSICDGGQLFVAAAVYLGPLVRESESFVDG